MNKREEHPIITQERHRVIRQYFQDCGKSTQMRGHHVRSVDAVFLEKAGEFEKWLMHRAIELYHLKGFTTMKEGATNE